MILPGLPADASKPGDTAEKLLTDFTQGTEDMGWFVLNDNVMGGRSEGGFTLADGELHFTGSTNTQGGGFSSIRTKPMRLDLSQHAGIRLHVKGDGRRYTWRLSTTARWRGQEISYWADFDTLDNEWSVVDIPFSRFVPRFRGMTLDGPALDISKITGMGLMIYDKQDGPFEMRLARLGAYSYQDDFNLSQLEWQHRVLVLSAATADDPDYKQQLQDLRASTDEFADRDMVLVTLLDDSNSMAGDRSLTAYEVAAMRSSLKIGPGAFALRLIGKDGSVKLSSASATSITEIYALIDTMPMRRQELRK